MFIVSPMRRTLPMYSVAADLIMCYKPDVIYIDYPDILDHIPDVHSRYLNVLDGVEIVKAHGEIAIRRGLDDKGRKVLVLATYSILLKKLIEHPDIRIPVGNSLIYPSPSEIEVPLRQITRALNGVLS